MPDTSGTKRTKIRIKRMNKIADAGGQYNTISDVDVVSQRIKDDLTQHGKVLYEEAPVYIHNHASYFTFATLNVKNLKTTLTRGLNAVYRQWQEDKKNILAIVAEKEQKFEAWVQSLGFKSAEDYFKIVYAAIEHGKVDIKFNGTELSFTARQGGKNSRTFQLNSAIVDKDKFNSALKGPDGKKLSGKKSLAELEQLANLYNDLTKALIFMAEDGGVSPEATRMFTTARDKMLGWINMHKQNNMASTNRDFANTGTISDSEAFKQKTTAMTAEQLMAWYRDEGDSSLIRDYPYLGLLRINRLEKETGGWPTYIEPLVGYAAREALIFGAENIIDEALRQEKLQQAKKTTVTHTGSDGSKDTTTDIKLGTVVGNIDFSVKRSALRQTKNNKWQLFTSQLQGMEQYNNVWRPIVDQQQNLTLLGRAIQYYIFNKGMMQEAQGSPELENIIGEIMMIASLNEKLFGYNKQGQINQQNNRGQGYDLATLIDSFPVYWFSSENGGFGSMAALIKQIDKLLKINKSNIKRIGSFSIGSISEGTLFDLYSAKSSYISTQYSNGDTAKTVNYTSIKKSDEVTQALIQANDLMSRKLSLSVRFTIAEMANQIKQAQAQKKGTK